MERTWCKQAPAADLLIKGGRVVDPEAGIDAVQDVLIGKGKVAELGSGLNPGKNTREIDARGMLVLPGFVDLHAHLRTPGREDEEDITSGTRAAAAGGYVAVFAMANTDPVVDTATVLRGLAQTARAEAAIPVGFFAAVTRGLAGEQLTEMGELGAAGAVGFSDDGRPLATAALTRRALQYVKVSGRFVAVHAQDDSLFKGGQMHEGPVSARLGLTGIPSLCESLDVSRTLDIAEYEDAAVHICHVSTAASSYSAMSRVRETSRLSQSDGMPVSPSLAETGPSCIWPPLKSDSSWAWTATKRPLTLTYWRARRMSAAVARGRPSSLKPTAPAAPSSPISVSCSPASPRVTAAKNPTGIAASARAVSASSSTMGVLW